MTTTTRRWAGCRAALFLACLVLPATARPAHAQGATILSGGYSFLHELGTESTPASDYPRGWYASGGWQLGATRFVVMGEVSDNRRTNFDIEVQRLQAFLGGTRIGLMKMAGVELYAVALAGMERFSEPGFSENGFAFQTGGGADIPLVKRVGARIEVDYRITTVEDATFQGVRVIVGAVIRIGGT